MRFLVFTILLLSTFSKLSFPQWNVQQQVLSTKVFSIYFPDSLTGFMANDLGQVAKTTNSGETWTVISTGTSNALRYGFFHNSFLGYFVGTNGTIIKTTSGGDSWIVQSSGTANMLVSISFPSLNVGYAVGDGNTIIKTTNGGQNWFPINSPISTDYRAVHFVDTLTGWISGFYGSLLKTTNGGATWIQYPVFTNQTIRDIDFPTQSIGYLAGNYGLVYKTTNSGTSWIQQSTATGSVLNDLFFLNEDRGYAVGTTGAILYTSNGGLNWYNQSSSTNNDLYCVCFTNQDVGYCVGGASESIYLKTINGGGGVLPVELTYFTGQAENQKIVLKWKTASELNNNGFEIQRKDSKSDFRTIGFVQGGGTTSIPKEYFYSDYNLSSEKYFYKLKQIDFNGRYEYSNVIEIDFLSIDKFTLEQNFPNPFNPSTKIIYQLPLANEVSLKVYDVLGNEVATIVNEYKEAGRYEAQFNGSELTSGIYFYELKTGKYTENKKMIILK